MADDSLTTVNFPDSIKHIHIYVASPPTTEVAAALLLTMRLQHEFPDKIKIVASYELNRTDILYILICPAGMLEPGVSDKPPLYYINYQLEPFVNTERNCFTERYCQLLRGAIDNWEYSYRNVDIVAQAHDIKLRYLPIGYNETISQPDIINGSYLYNDEHKDVDVSFLGWSGAPHRKKIADLLYSAGCRIFFVSRLDLVGMQSVIRRSKICLNLHRGPEISSLETLRLNILLSNQACIISEDTIDTHAKEIYNNMGVIFVDYDKIVDKVREILPNYEQRRNLATSSYQQYRCNMRWIDLVNLSNILPTLK